MNLPEARTGKRQYEVNVGSEIGLSWALFVGFAFDPCAFNVLITFSLLARRLSNLLTTQVSTEWHFQVPG